MLGKNFHIFLLSALCFFALTGKLFAQNEFEWKNVTDKFGQQLTVKENVQTRAAHRVYGNFVNISHYGVNPSELSLENVDETARKFLSDYQDIIKISPDNLSTVKTLNMNANWYLSYQQIYEGIPVFSTHVGFTIEKDGRIRCIGADIYTNIEAKTTPLISDKQAIEIAETDFKTDGVEKAELVREISLLIYPEIVDKVINYYLVYSVELSSPSPAKQWIYFVDAFNGEIIYRADAFEGSHYNTIVNCFNAHGINTFASCQQKLFKRGISDDNKEVIAGDHNYFPLQVGNIWYYGYPIPPSNPWDMKMIRDSLLINGLTYYVWTYGDSVDIFDTLRTDQQHNIWKYHNGVDYLWFDFQKDSGAVYNFPPGDLGENESEKCKVYVETNFQVETPAGIFENCISFTFDVYQFKDEEMTYTFAENVGPVAIRVGLAGTERLTCAIINGKIIASVNSPAYEQKGYLLLQNYPNPFNPSTNIRFELPKTVFVTLQVFDVLGHRVRTLANGIMSVGSHTVSWDGKNIAGEDVAAGVYFANLRMGSEVRTIKLLLVR